MGKCYCTDRAKTVLADYIASGKQLDLKDDLLKVMFFSILSNGNTSKSITVQEVIYFIYLNDSKLKLKCVSMKYIEKQKQSRI